MRRSWDDCYNAPMNTVHPKAVRRRLLTILYQRYMNNPLDMLGPSDFLTEEGLSRQDLVVNIHYLHDAGLAELMVGYNPQSFNAVRITAKGVDLFEDSYRFNRRFPAGAGEEDFPLSEAARLVEELLAQVDLVPVDAETRRGLLQDIEYLRSELSRPAGSRRPEVLRALSGWIASVLGAHGEGLSTLAALEALFVPLEKKNPV